MVNQIEEQQQAMAPPPSPSFAFSIPIAPKTPQQIEEEQQAYKAYDQVIASLPFLQSIGFGSYIMYQSFWYPEHLLPATMAIHDTFVACPSDLIVATQPKSGTTWLKALIFSIVKRASFPPDHPNHPLLASSPHDCVPFLHTLYENRTLPTYLDALPSPRLLATHSPYSSLPLSVRESGCRVVYLCRDPKDTLVSLWHYLKKLYGRVVPFDEAFDMMCNGHSPFGPIWDHVLEYWRESRRRPEKVLFLRYEELMVNTAEEVKRMAQFAGCALSSEEEEKGVAEAIVKLCSFEKLSKLEVNQNGVHSSTAPFRNTVFFRKGKIGDWGEHLTPGMAQKLDAIVRDKFEVEGLLF